MANKTIPQLPEQTGKTDDDLLVIVDSGETTTSKIKVSTLLDGVGAAGVTGDTLNDSISSVNSIVGTPNVFFGSSGYTNFGYGNEVFDDSIVYGYNNVSSSNVANKEICIGYNNNFKTTTSTGNEAGNITIGHGNTKQSDGIIIGKDNTGSRGLYLGFNLTSNSGNDIAGLSLVGRNITSSGVRGAAQGGNISNLGDFSISHGWFNNHNNREATIASGWGNTINSNGSLTFGYNVAIGLNNTITGGNGQFNLSSDSDITSTGTHNTILGGYQNNITGTTSGTTIIGLTGHTATSSDMVYVPALNVVNYASLDFADDAAAALGGVELGGLYHNSGAVRIRIT